MARETVPARAGLDLFDKVVGGTTGFRARPGQRTMARCVAETFASDGPRDGEPSVARTTVISAGTGTGKTAAYAAAAIGVALRSGSKVVISTSTVALMDQLVGKDLPAIAAVADRPIAVAVAKGRGRYVCRLKVERAVGAGTVLEGPDGDGAGTTGVASMAHRAAEELKSGWDGDRDSLNPAPRDGEWSTVAADRHSCTGRHCPRYQGCTFVEKRRELAAADVIVTNHSLLLSSLGTSVLPDLSTCLLVLDEAHDLAASAGDQFASSADLTRLGWIDGLARACQSAAAGLDGYELDRQFLVNVKDLKLALADVGRFCLDNLASFMDADGVFRFTGGIVPEFLYEPLSLVESNLKAICSQTSALAQALRDAMATSAAGPALGDLYAGVGCFAPRLDGLVSTVQLLIADGQRGPVARWVHADASPTGVALSLHACPLDTGELLAAHLWPATRRVVLTSATIRTCGSFEFFLKGAGLKGRDGLTTLHVDSPFDYARQGRMIIAETKSDPKRQDLHTAEVAGQLAVDLESLKDGALILCSSKRQMRGLVDQLPVRLRALLLVQGTESKGELLARHRARVGAGEPSVLVGLASFGQGVDLPGRQCSYLGIVKVPFAAPAEPVAQARAEYLATTGGDPFDEIAVPEAGLRLLQWTGRAIRTETDRATIVCFDRRLARTSYGRRLLRGLPRYAMYVRRDGDLEPLEMAA